MRSNPLAFAGLHSEKVLNLLVEESFKMYSYYLDDVSLSFLIFDFQRYTNLLYYSQGHDRYTLYCIVNAVGRASLPHRGLSLIFQV